MRQSERVQVEERRGKEGHLAIGWDDCLLLDSQSGEECGTVDGGQATGVRLLTRSQLGGRKQDGLQEPAGQTNRAQATWPCTVSSILLARGSILPMHPIRSHRTGSLAASSPWAGGSHTVLSSC